MNTKMIGPNDRHAREKEGAKDFAYVLEDLLEMKASLDPRRTKPLRDFLLAQGIVTYHISFLEGFTLDGHLVLIQGGDPRAFGRLVFLNPRDGKICVRSFQKAD